MVKKNLAVFFDGTWNEPNDRTNVYELYKAAPETSTQETLYIEGVGTQGQGLWAAIDKFMGGAFGAGLSANIRQGYRWLCQRHQPGDRREYFQAPEDVWEIFKRLAEERRRREIEPTQSMLRAAMMEEASTDEERYAQQRMRDMHELIDKLMSWFDDVQRLSPETAMQLMGMGSAVTRLLDLKDKITGRGKSGTQA